MCDLSHHWLKAPLTGLCHHPQHTWQPQQRALRGSESLTLTRPPSSPLPNTKAKAKAVPIPLALDELKYDWMCPGRSLHYLALWGMAPGWGSEHLGAEIRSTGAGHWLTFPIQVPNDPPVLWKTFPVLDAETVGPVTNSQCSATVQEASAFLLHSQLASAFGEGSVFKQEGCNPWILFHPCISSTSSTQVFNLTSVTERHIQPLPILKHLPSGKLDLSGALFQVSQCEWSYTQTKTLTSQQCSSFFPWPPCRRAGLEGSGRCWEALCDYWLPHTGGAVESLEQVLRLSLDLQQ